MSKISDDSHLSFPKERIPDYLALIKWLEQSGDRELIQLVKLAKQGKPLPSQKLKKLVSSLINDPQDLYGKIMASKDVKHHAELTAACTNIANLIDFVSNFPFFLYAFQFLATPIGFSLSFLSNGLLLVFSNKVATIAANKTKHGHFWSKVGVGTMIALGILKSSVSGVGGELLMNQPELKKILAQELIDEEQAKVEELKELGTSPELEARKQELKQKETELNSFDRTHPRWNSLYVEINGSWSDRDRDWSQAPAEQLPLSELVKRLEKEAARAYETAKASLDEKLVKRSEIGNDRIFLKQEMPNVYDTAFTENGEIASGTKAIELAMVNFFGKLITGQWLSLGFSLFFFSLSVLTSSASILLTLRYANREDVQQSQIKEEKANNLLDDWLTQKWMDNLQPSQSSLLYPTEFLNKDKTQNGN